MRWRRRKRRRKRPESSVSDWVQGFYTERGDLGISPPLGFFYHLVIIICECGENESPTHYLPPPLEKIPV